MEDFFSFFPTIFVAGNVISSNDQYNQIMFFQSYLLTLLMLIMYQWKTRKKIKSLIFLSSKVTAKLL